MKTLTNALTADLADGLALLAQADSLEERGEDPSFWQTLGGLVLANPWLGCHLMEFRDLLGPLQDYKKDGQNYNYQRFLANAVQQSWMTDAKVLARLGPKLHKRVSSWKRGEAHPISTLGVLEEARRAIRPLELDGCEFRSDNSKGDKVAILLRHSREIWAVQARYYGLLLRAFPEARWLGSSCEQPIRLVQEDETVALLMPLRP